MNKEIKNNEKNSLNRLKITEIIEKVLDENHDEKDEIYWCEKFPNFDKKVHHLLAKVSKQRYYNETYILTKRKGVFKLN